MLGWWHWPYITIHKKKKRFLHEAGLLFWSSGCWCEMSEGICLSQWQVSKQQFLEGMWPEERKREELGRTSDNAHIRSFIFINRMTSKNSSVKGQDVFNTPYLRPQSQKVGQFSIHWSSFGKGSIHSWDHLWQGLVILHGYKGWMHTQYIMKMHAGIEPYKPTRFLHPGWFVELHSLSQSRMIMG